VSAHHLEAFAALAFAVIVAPGPSVLFVISRGVTLGRRAALATVVGNSAGVGVQVVAVAVGVGLFVQRSLVVFSVVKLAGAAYLVLLGVRTITQRHRLAEALEAGLAARTNRRILREGFVVGVSNPKTIVFLVAILPQFAERSQGHVPGQLLLLGMIFVAIALLSDSAWGLAAGSARQWLERSPRRLAAVGGTGGLVIIGLGVSLAVAGRSK
jgi:threonine/homoserine/homoserine lactone efflux protein